VSPSLAVSALVLSLITLLPPNGREPTGTSLEVDLVSVLEILSISGGITTVPTVATVAALPSAFLVSTFEAAFPIAYPLAVFVILLVPGFAALADLAAPLAATAAALFTWFFAICLAATPTPILSAPIQQVLKKLALSTHRHSNRIFVNKNVFNFSCKFLFVNCSSFRYIDVYNYSTIVSVGAASTSCPSTLWFCKQRSS
jgi:hypothetical protein